MRVEKDLLQAKGPVRGSTCAGRAICVSTQTGFHQQDIRGAISRASCVEQV